MGLQSAKINYLSVLISYYTHDFVHFPNHTVCMGNHQDLDIFYALSLCAQYIISIPQRNMIAVRLGRKFGTLLPRHHQENYLFLLMFI